MGLIFALHGAKGAGKDEFYKIAKDYFADLDVRKISYADPIRQEVSRIFNLRDVEEYDQFKRNELTYTLPGRAPRTVDGRQVVREIGMMMRSYNENQFVEYVERQIESAPDAVWCITDLRFDNELVSVKALDAVVVKILRAGVNYDGHVTEVEIPNALCDHVVCNDGDISDYQYEVVSLVEHVMHYHAPELLSEEE